MERTWRGLRLAVTCGGGKSRWQQVWFKVKVADLTVMHCGPGAPRTCSAHHCVETLLGISQPLQHVPREDTWNRGMRKRRVHMEAKGLDQERSSLLEHWWSQSWTLNHSIYFSRETNMIDPGPDHTESQRKGDSQRSSMSGSVNGRAANGTPAAVLECISHLPASQTTGPCRPFQCWLSQDYA